MQLPGFGDDSHRKQVTFDEETIADHDKERGTRMVIPDPDTPFFRSPVVSDDESDTHTRTARRNPHAMMAGFLDTQAISPTSSLASNSDNERKQREFREKRRAFYNEFRVMKGSNSSSSHTESDPTPKSSDA